MVRSFPEGLDDILDGFLDKSFYLFLLVGIFSIKFCVGHQMDEEMGHLVNEFKRFSVFEDYFFTVSFFVSFAVSVLIKRLSLEHLEIWIFHVSA